MLIDSINSSASALTANRLWMDLIANNIANINTTHTPGGGPYRRQVPVFEARTRQGSFGGALGQAMSGSGAAGVQVAAVKGDQSPFKMKYEPGNPDANAQGYVAYPNVNLSTEITDLVAASRSYQANIVAVNTAKSMALEALKIGQ